MLSNRAKAARTLPEWHISKLKGYKRRGSPAYHRNEMGSYSLHIGSASHSLNIIAYRGQGVLGPEESANLREFYQGY